MNTRLYYKKILVKKYEYILSQKAPFYELKRLCIKIIFV